MVRVTVLPAGIEIRTRAGESLASALVRAGFDLGTPCGGLGTCGGCRVRIEPPEAAPSVACDSIEPDDQRRGWRPACRVHVWEDLSVRLPGGVARKPTQPAPCRARPTTGLALDVGTTSLEGALIELEGGRRLAEASVLNPQVRLGPDVISRIARAASPAGLDGLVEAVRGGLVELIAHLGARAGVDVAGIRRAVLTGNPTMVQIALGQDPGPLGCAPWTVGEPGGREVDARDLGLTLDPLARVYLPPVAQAFFGADAIAGLASLDRLLDGRGAGLFVDMGTNGELALVARGRLWCTSAAAGPAFEGMGLSCGARAIPGAIDAIDVTDGGLVCSTVGGAAAVGVCGSGLVDLLAALLDLGVLAPSGRLAGGSYRITPQVSLSQKDVRAAQLAVGAVRVAIDLLLDEAGVDVEQVEQVAVAGAFGRALRPVGLEAIGMLPPGLAARVVPVGNASLDGAARLLVEPGRRPEVEALARRLEHVPLTDRADFEERFLCRLRFPG